MAEIEPTLPVVIYHGSSMFKLGFGGEDAPRYVVPPIYGVPKMSNIMGLQKDHFLFDEAYSKAGVLTLHRPYAAGVISDWDKMEMLWHGSFYNELRVAPEEHSVLLSDTTSSPRSSRMTMCE